MKQEQPAASPRRVYRKNPARASRRRRRRRARRLAGIGAMLAILALLVLAVRWMLAGSELSRPAGAPAPTAAPTAVPAPTATPPAQQEGPAAPTATPAPEGDTPAQAAARAALDAYLDTLPGSVSVLAVRPSDGLTYARDPDRSYYAASLLKAPYALWLYSRAAQGQLDLNETLPGWTRLEEVLLSQEEQAAGLPTPTPQLATVPDRTAREAVALMVGQSNNSAAEQLYTRWPATAATGFVDFLSSLGLDMTGRVANLSLATGMSGNLSPAEAVRVLTALQTFFDSGTADGEELKQAFLNARSNYLTFDWPMARKYGNWIDALHDIAIVYAPDPYYVAVFTDWGDPAKVDPQCKEYYRQISALLAALLES